MEVWDETQPNQLDTKLMPNYCLKVGLEVKKWRNALVTWVEAQSFHSQLIRFILLSNTYMCRNQLWFLRPIYIQPSQPFTTLNSTLSKETSFLPKVISYQLYFKALYAFGLMCTFFNLKTPQLSNYNGPCFFNHIFTYNGFNCLVGRW